MYGGHNDYPWYGRTYNCALEPFTGYPPAGVQNAIKIGTALFMKPGETIKTEMVAVTYDQGKARWVKLDGSVEQ